MDKSEHELPYKRESFLSDVREINIEALRWQQEINLVIGGCAFHRSLLICLLVEM